jgi:hypothetical protein
MPDSLPMDGLRRWPAALVVSGVVVLLTALSGVVLFLAGCAVLGVDVWQAYPAMLAALLARGPLGYAAWMALLMAAGSPLVGAAVFAMLYFARR